MADSPNNTTAPENETTPAPMSFEDHLMFARGLVKAVRVFALGLEDDNEKQGLDILSIVLGEHMDALQDGFTKAMVRP